MNHIQSICLGAGITQIITILILPKWMASERYISMGLAILATSFLVWYYRNKDHLGVVQSVFIGVGLACIPIAWWKYFNDGDHYGAHLSLIVIPLILAGMTYKSQNE